MEISMIYVFVKKKQSSILVGAFFITKIPLKISWVLLPNKLTVCLLADVTHMIYLLVCLFGRDLVL